MLTRLLSNDLPRSRILAVILLALFSNILLMMAILLWRPQGVYALSK